MHKQILKKDVYPLLKLAIPLILTSLIQSSQYFVQTIFLSRLGETVMAASALIGWLFATLIVVLFGTFSAVNILIAYKYGANKQSDIVLILRDGLLLALLLTTPIFLLFWNISPILSFLGQNTELVILAEIYLHALAWGLLPKFILIVLFELIIGLGHTRTIMIINILTVPVYIFFSFVLIFGKLGLPALGIAGAGWGITGADWLIALSLFIFLLYNTHYQFYIRSIFTKKLPFYLWEILHLGIPIGLMYCLEVGFFFAMALIMGTISTSALAANQITMQYLGPLMGVIFSIAQAVTVRMGHQIGAKQVYDAKKTAYAGMIVSVIFMFFISLCYWIFPKLLISADFDIHNVAYDKTVQLACQFLFIAAFFQMLESVRISLFGALRALKDTRFTLFASVIGFWIIPLPIGYILAFPLGFQGGGLWWGMVFGVACSVLLLHYRFQSKIKSVSNLISK